MSTLIHGLALHMFKRTPDLDPFPHKLHVLKDEEGVSFVIEEIENNEVRRIPMSVVGEYLLRFIAEQGFPLGMSKITSDHVRNILADFVARAPRIQEPAMVLQAHEPGLTYRKLPFSFESDLSLERSPTFREMMARTTNGLALMAWVGSLFDPAADMQQYVWLHGSGQNGKSSLGRFLSAVLGNGARSVQPPGLNDKFWTINLIGKRLVIYGDCNNAKFVTCGLFKSMTGGDAISAEIKMGATLQVVLKAKHLFFSNKKPAIDAGEADQRRIILCEMGPIAGDPDPFYEQRLWDEAPTFLGECINAYEQLAGPGRRIPCDQTAARDLAHENDEVFETVFFQKFILRPGRALAANKFVEMVREAGIRENSDIRRFREFIEKNHGIVRTRIPGGGFHYDGIVENIYANQIG